MPASSSVSAWGARPSEAGWWVLVFWSSAAPALSPPMPAHLHRWRPPLRPAPPFSPTLRRQHAAGAVCTVRGAAVAAQDRAHAGPVPQEAARGAWAVVEVAARAAAMRVAAGRLACAAGLSSATPGLPPPWAHPPLQVHNGYVQAKRKFEVGAGLGAGLGTRVLQPLHLASGARAPAAGCWVLGAGLLTACGRRAANRSCPCWLHPTLRPAGGAGPKALAGSGQR